jgi:hypothetical protein
MRLKARSKQITSCGVTIGAQRISRTLHFGQAQDEVTLVPPERGCRRCRSRGIAMFSMGHDATSRG